MRSFPSENKAFYFLSLFFSKLEDNSKQALTFFGSWTSPLMGVYLTKALHVGLAEKRIIKLSQFQVFQLQQLDHTH